MRWTHATHRTRKPGPNLFGGTDVVSLYGREDRIRTNRLHCPSDEAASRVVQQSRQLERAELVELPEATSGTCQCPRCGRTGLLDQDFGTRVLNGQRRRQSWCRRRRSRGRGPLTLPAAAGSPHRLPRL